MGPGRGGIQGPESPGREARRSSRHRGHELDAGLHSFRPGEFDEAGRSIDDFVALSIKRNPTREAITGTMKAVLRARLISRAGGRRRSWRRSPGRRRWPPAWTRPQTTTCSSQRRPGESGGGPGPGRTDEAAALGEGAWPCGPS
ncbi:MAG: hypothetical protein MZU84_09205 [Sphingobacterium sp.]|nr:hypothetical protein [Sphingobacterium sp.]